MTTDKTTYLPVEDEPEPSGFYGFYVELTTPRNPWDHHHDSDVEEFYPVDQTPPF